MSILLPRPIDLYVKIENAGDVETPSECFASDAAVRDEGHTYEGLAAIKEWKAETKKKYNHAVARSLIGTERQSSRPNSPAIFPAALWRSNSASCWRSLEIH
jgi:hypothetical protein